MSFSSESFKKNLRNKGLRMTAQREIILRQVLQMGRHPSAEEVYAAVRRQLPMISLDTVYRTLRLLAQLGELEIVSADHRRLRFDTDIRTHHHFVCNRCGAIQDFFSPQFDQLTIPLQAVEFGHVARVQVEFRGICHHCLKSSPGVKE